MNIKEKVDIQIQIARDGLAQDCRILSQHLLSLANKLVSNTPHQNLYINDLGEIQSAGTIIDAKCGRLMGKIGVWGLLDDS